MKIVILLTFICVTGSFAQQSTNMENEAIKGVINNFFLSLEKQDTILMQSTLYPEGQVWTLRHMADSTVPRMRFFKDDFKGFDPKMKFLETPLSFDIKGHQGMAVAWVPYTFHINDKFSHCGVDIFTLMKKENDWKISRKGIS